MHTTGGSEIGIDCHWYPFQPQLRAHSRSFVSLVTCCIVLDRHSQRSSVGRPILPRSWLNSYCVHSCRHSHACISCVKTRLLVLWLQVCPKQHLSIYSIHARSVCKGMRQCLRKRAHSKTCSSQRTDIYACMLFQVSKIRLFGTAC